MAVGQRPVKLTAKQEREAYRLVTERDQGMCQRCGYRGPVERDHRQGRNAYNTVPSNLQCLGAALGGCGCHKWVTEHPEQAVLEGFTVPRWAHPQLWPAYRIGAGWVLYFDTPDADGNWWQPISQATADLIMNGDTQ